MWGIPLHPPPHKLPQTFPAFTVKPAEVHNSSQRDDHIRNHEMYLLSTLNLSIQVYSFVLGLGLELGSFYIKLLS